MLVHTVVGKSTVDYRSLAMRIKAGRYYLFKYLAIGRSAHVCVLWYQRPLLNAEQDRHVMDLVAELKSRDSEDCISTIMCYTGRTVFGVCHACSQAPTTVLDERPWPRIPQRISRYLCKQVPIYPSALHHHLSQHCRGIEHS